MPKRTHQPKVRHRKRVHGFRAKSATPAGRKTIKARKAKGRTRITH